MWNTIFYLFTSGSFASAASTSTTPAKAQKEQNIWADEDTLSTAKDNLLIVSPYTSRPHLLDLKTLNRSEIFLAKALTVLSPVTHAYATVPYTESFNWEDVFSSLAVAVKEDAFQWTGQFFYIVVFRSQVPPSTDRSHLAALDKTAHMEAMRSGGLLKYWFGLPDGDGRNLATCKLLARSAGSRVVDMLEGIWRRREDAAPGSSGEGHKAAMRATIAMYSEWHIERLKLVVSDNVDTWEIVPWED
ncbi:MAG: hypothetical protein Q9184_006082 [Pyrenodesmia sp. 2 TL-2023]